MGFYVNPGNENFRQILNDVYIDKSGLISVINGTIGKRNRLSCVSRPRRFGKSYAAKMLVAYYDCSVDSHVLFEGREISNDPSYEENINKYNVLYLDITGFMSDASIGELPSGTGYVDMAYIPKRYDPSPALIIELKAGGTPEDAMEQIISRNYPASIDGLGAGARLVAITYDKDDKTKLHHCRIEDI